MSHQLNTPTSKSLELSKKLGLTLFISVVTASMGSLTGCTSLFTDSDSTSNQLANTNNASIEADVLSSGSLTLAKRMPAISEPTALPLYGFIPFQLSSPLNQREQTNWIEIDLTENSLSFKNGAEQLLTTNLDPDTINILQNQKGIHTIQHKAESPLWHAPESYFIERNMNVPAEGDASRFLKGALGSHTLFLEDGLTIHNGPISLPDGVKVDSRMLADIYAQSELGTKVVIR